MNRILHLIRLDLKQVMRDSMLAIALVGPLILILVVRYGIPFIGEWIYKQFTLDIMTYSDLILSFVLVLIPLMLGMLTGFMMLDERDENLIEYYAITPLRKMGYFLYRLTIPVVLSLLYNVLLLCSVQTQLPPLVSIIPVLLMLALEAPLITLLLVGFANNKIEGLALSKGIGLVVFVPAIVYFMAFPWQLVASFIPTYWAAQTLISSMQDNLINSMIYAIIGLLVHALTLWVLAIRYSRKVD